MALQLGALRAALLEAGASDNSAHKAAEEVATYGRELSDIKGSLRAITATLAILSSLTLLSIGGQFAIWSKLGEISARLSH